MTGLTISGDFGNRQSFARVVPSYTWDDIIGSPYAISDYVWCVPSVVFCSVAIGSWASCWIRSNPAIGTDEEVVALRKKLNGMQMRLMLDFVPNHSSLDSPYVRSHPEYYVRVVRGQRIDPLRYSPEGIAFGGGDNNCWIDTLQWNYWSADLRQFLVRVLFKIAGMCDGVRCDTAALILSANFEKNWGGLLRPSGFSPPPTEFWADAIGQIRARHPAFMFLAESYGESGPPLLRCGFDFVYDMAPYDLLGTARSLGSSTH